MLSGLFTPSAANALWSIFGLLVAGSITLVGYKIKTWPLVKMRITEAKLADDQIEGSSWKRWQDEIARLDARIKVLEKDVAECKAREFAAERRALVAETEAARLRAFNAGRGEARQEAAIVDSARRIVERDGGDK